MVDPVTSSIAGRLRPAREAEDTTLPARAVAQGQEAAPTRREADRVILSAEARGMPAELKAGPPMDIEIVRKIKEQIAEGKYPIDLEAITDSLFQSYRELAN